MLRVKTPRKAGPVTTKLSRKGLVKKLDRLWSEVISLRDRECVRCGGGRYLNAHHIFSRSNFPVRWDLDNGILLCAGCHVLKTESAHKAPADFIEWLIDERGRVWYDNLRLKAHRTPEKDYEKLLEDLREKKQILEKLKGGIRVRQKKKLKWLRTP